MFFSNSKKRTAERDRNNLLANLPSNSRYAEAFRTLRTNLFFSVMEKEIKSIVVTSAVEKEGKTNTAANLAFTMAQADRRVLLMDCDLRRPHLTSLLLGKQKKGLGVSGLVTDTFGVRLTKGKLDTISINDLLLMTKLQQRSCCLDIENDLTSVSIYFEKGLMTDIYWKNRPESKKLANTLIKHKLLTEKEASLALGKQKKSIQRLGTVLYTMGFVSKKDISKALAVHTIEAIKAVSSMIDGKFEYSSLSHEENQTPIDQDLDFEKLYTEFSTGTEQLKYIKKNVDSAIRKTEADNLFLLPAGNIPPNPSELIASKQMGFLVRYLKKRFDFIVIDSPPVMPATDSILIAPRTEGTVFVMRSGHADRKIIKDGIDQFKTAQLPIIGTVLNQVDMKKEGYYRYYNKYYSSYYGN